MIKNYPDPVHNSEEGWPHDEPHSHNCGESCHAHHEEEGWMKTMRALQQQRLPKVGRNDSCPCGSGKKYKKCCLRLSAA